MAFPQQAAELVNKLGLDFDQLFCSSVLPDLPAEAGTLSRVLQDEKLRVFATEFAENDPSAVSSKGIYIRTVRWATLSALVGIVVCVAVLLLTSPNVLDPRPGIQHLGFGLVALGLALILVFVLIDLFVLSPRLVPRWMSARARAEIARIGIFRRLTAIDEIPANANELPALPLQLEVFRRFQLDAQIAAYRRMCTAARASIGVKAVGSALVLVGLFGLAILAGRSLIVAEAAQMKGAAALTALFGVGLFQLSFLRFARHDARNANRYGTTLGNLEYIRDTYLDRVRSAAASNNRPLVIAFVDCVNEQVSSEHREWLPLDQREPAGWHEVLVRELASHKD